MVNELSNHIAELVARVAPSVVQVEGQGRPASGLVYGDDVVITTARAVGESEHPRVRAAGGEAIDAEIAGWDPATRLVVLKAPGLQLPAVTAGELPRVGEMAIALARSWSNAITATAGLVSVIGGPLRTGRRRAIEQVIRTSAPMHEGFAGGALLGTDGRLLGVTTAASIRGFGVVIPAGLAWSTAAEVLRRGTLKRGYLGIAAQPARVSERQKGAAGVDRALLVVDVKPGTPADEAGLLVGDLLLSVDGRTLSSPDELFDLLVGDRVGKSVGARVLRGGVVTDLAVTAAERR
ncbi:MAG TPA: S1C family serine protease [Vicinamibacterales bacterium]|jgi:S1-C subfamily serine protease|nr:S1C family serine protease [Vicinamibacterales bacterium]